MYCKILKRFFDLLAALVLFIALSPIILLLSIVLFVDFKGNPFFVQRRPGLNNRIFRLIKFKTMNNNRDENGNLLPDKARITALGRFVRSSSMDELPQLINVIKGDMSLVGPRPLLEKYIPLYNEEQIRRHEVRPGITGWSQINGRNTITWEEKFKMDVWYVDNCSLKLDVRILLLTIKKVILREGINLGNEITMEVFKGKDSNSSTKDNKQ